MGKEMELPAFVCDIRDIGDSLFVYVVSDAPISFTDIVCAAQTYCDTFGISAKLSAANCVDSQSLGNYSNRTKHVFNLTSV